MFRALKTWLLLIVLLVAGAAGVHRYYQDYSKQSAVTYRTEKLDQGDVTKRVSSTGSLRSVTNTSVGCEISGTVIKLYVDYNSKVRKGDLLALIDPSNLKALVEQQEATLSDTQASYLNAVANLENARSGVPKADAAVYSARAQVEAARATVANSQAGVVTARANIKKARASLENNSAAYQRQQVLLARNLVARSDVDMAKSTFLQDKANLDSVISQANAAEASYRSNLATLQARQSDVNSALASRTGAAAQERAAAAQVTSAGSKVRQARASLQQQRLNLARTRITSPINGIVIDRKVNIGQTVAASFQAPDLFTLAEDLEQMQVEVSVDEADIGMVKKGAPVTFTVDSFPEDSFAGNVTEVRLAATSTSGVITYTVVVRCTNPKLKLMPGMTATVAIQVDSREDVLLVPNSALRFKAPQQPGETHTRTATRTPGASGSPGRRGGRRRGGGGTRLYTLDGDKLVPHRVKLGISDGAKTEIVHSDPELKVGDLVVVEAIGGGATPSPAAAPAGGGRGPGGHPPRMF